MHPNYCFRDKVSPGGTGLRAQRRWFCCSPSLVSYFCYLFNILNYAVFLSMFNIMNYVVLSFC
ncbi:unnamed protein product [Prunus brigantina]